MVTYSLIGIFVGGIYALIGLGIVTVYKATKVFNFAVGAMVALGGLICVSFLGYQGVPVWLGIVLAILAMGVIGLLLQRGVLNSFVERPPLTAMIATCAFIYLLEGVSTLGWGGMPRSLTRVSEILPTGAIKIGGGEIPLELAWSFLIAIVLLGIFVWLFQYTKVGVGLRATAEDTVTARSKGVPVRWMHGAVWVVVGLTAAVGGILLGYRSGINPVLSLIGLKAFPVVFLGGLESIVGVIVGGLIIGVTEVMVGAYVSSDWMEVTPFLILVLILIIRPQGLFGEKPVERI